MLTMTNINHGKELGIWEIVSGVANWENNATANGLPVSGLRKQEKSASTNSESAPVIQVIAVETWEVTNMGDPCGLGCIEHPSIVGVKAMPLQE